MEKAGERGNMSKRIIIDGKAFRERRGKLVEIPAEWVGKTLYPQTKRKRHSNNALSRRMRKLKNKST